MRLAFMKIGNGIMLLSFELIGLLCKIWLCQCIFDTEINYTSTPKKKGNKVGSRRLFLAELSHWRSNQKGMRFDFVCTSFRATGIQIKHDFCTLLTCEPKCSDSFRSLNVSCFLAPMNLHRTSQLLGSLADSEILMICTYPLMIYLNQIFFFILLPHFICVDTLSSGV